MTRLLVLRPEPGASATVERARRHGFKAVAVPLFRVEPVSWRAPQTELFDGLLLTSANAVRHGGEQLRALQRLKVYSVGKQTAMEAQEAGFTVAATGEAGVDELLACIGSELKLLHLCGADRRQPKGTSGKITELVVYQSKQIAAPDLSAARDAVVLIHSQRAARRFAELVTDRATISIAAISGAAASAAGDGWRAVESVDRPSDEALLALAARLCNKSH
jgi:uroporphyrinogen-III synthase